MNFLLYISGYTYFVFSWFRLRRTIDSASLLLISTVVLVPLGKLVYLHVPMLIGFKFCFLYLCFCLLLLAIAALHRPVRISQDALLLFSFIVPALISVVFVRDSRMLISYQSGEGQTDSVLARLISYVILLAFGAWIADFLIRREGALRSIADAYCSSMMFTCLVGFFIFVGVYAGRFGVEDLLPVSADTHLIGRIYRFNPGANVNEFGMLLGYGMLFVMWMERSTKWKALYLTIFIIAEFLTLTRASWIGVLVGVAAYLLRSDKKIRHAVVGISLVAILLLVASLNASVWELAISRGSLDIGASGQDRLDKYFAAYHELISSPWRILFGYGWSTNLYIHSVPFQIVYETGLLGFGLFSAMWAYLLLKLASIPKSKDHDLVVGLLLMLFTFATVHHTFYHMQSWLVVGIAWGVAARRANENPQEASQAVPA